MPQAKKMSTDSGKQDRRTNETESKRYTPSYRRATKRAKVMAKEKRNIYYNVRDCNINLLPFVL